MDHDAIARLDKKTGTRVLCGRRDADGRQRCPFEFGTLEGGAVRLAGNRWHRSPDSIIVRVDRRGRSADRNAVPRGAGSIIERMGRSARVSTLDAPALCRCETCETVNLIDPQQFVVERCG